MRRGFTIFGPQPKMASGSTHMGAPVSGSMVEEPPSGAGAFRAEPPGQTLRRLLPRLGEFGITRIADVTGLDRIGIPVAIAVRPNARSVTVSQGKGVDLASAKVSALMEAIEVWHAENIVSPLTLVGIGDIRASGRGCDVTRLPMVAGRARSDNDRLLWIEGRDLIVDRPKLVPFEMVHADYAPPEKPGYGLFPASTNGLASGNSPLEAMVAAICEVIERDALAVWHQLPQARRDAARLELGTVTDPACLWCLERMTAAALDIAVWGVTSDIGVASFLCLLRDPREGGHIGLGSGAHPDAATALLRALSEAAQTRLTYISGSRDDLDPEEFTALGRRKKQHFGETLAGAGTPVQDFAETPHFAADSTEGAPRLASREASGGRDRGGRRRRSQQGGRHFRLSRRHSRPRSAARRSRLRARAARSSGSGAMIAVIFAGPSLALGDAELPAGFVRQPPAGQGDVYRAAKARPRAIGLIDGYFEGVPSVWHKEILWAMANGIAVYGGASMGALRAAELAPFGMIGVGRIFESYRDGIIEADDEVALLHGPAETGFAPLTEPLVNVRATCDAASAAGIVAGDEAQAIVTAAQAIFYKERTWRAIAASLRGAGLVRRSPIGFRSVAPHRPGRPEAAGRRGYGSAHGDRSDNVFVRGANSLDLRRNISLGACRIRVGGAPAPRRPFARS